MELEVAADSATCKTKKCLIRGPSMSGKWWERFLRLEAVDSFIRNVFGISFVVTGVLGWLQSVPLVVIIPSALLSACCIVALREYWKWKTDQAKDPVAIQIPVQRPLKCWLSSGRVEDRAVLEGGPRGRYFVIKCFIQNPLDHTVNGLRIFLHSRSWAGKGALQTFEDFETEVNLGPNEAINPDEALEVTIMSMSAEDLKPYLGDHKDIAAELVLLTTPSVHFITIGITARDRKLEHKNIVIRTTSGEPALIACEFDARKWGDQLNSPHPWADCESML